MQKGSLVVLKSTQFALYKSAVYAMQNSRFPLFDTAYILSSDVEEEWCNECQENHKIVRLEEIPDEEYPYDLFKEVQQPSEVNIEELFTP